ncbi:hypothetical protein ACH33_07645 [Aneurinibacillus sp. XH2]|uniref:ImmA/IrrE family metallo-endopeptidase n=1 Tax=Aneurinibacillus sp. XH2 TaxID=1450761 RepID=UPI00070C315E|nr:ImmA/IrrE family metallo-endopeptidase [Aneurinibacillus sp. XH2]AMA72737.1 hypothetical protein ACH33_07645 [Aneurinibacillus sp. XH2]
MLELYRKTELETWIEEQFKEVGILEPRDLKISNIARQFGVEIEYMPYAPSNAIWDDDTVVVFIDSMKSDAEQKEIFYHELCHPLLHEGNQKNMSPFFRKLQEFQAEQFLMYAALPFFMINRFEIPYEEKGMVALLTQVFEVTPELAKRRVKQIRRRIFQTQLDRQFIQYLKEEDKRLIGHAISYRFEN